MLKHILKQASIQTLATLLISSAALAQQALTPAEESAKLSVVHLNNAVPSDEVTAQGGWQTLGGILYSSTDYNVAQKACNDGMQTLQIISTDNVVFQASCSYSVNSRCVYSSCFEMNSKVLFVRK